ncbi:hypothetical protein PILCRDRAFT_822380 [Piloderma croceum F 1598]|uniref:Uncharacterized protein n=1 Tax=Piloderma croceum (strain F 1598) TaxID=765440 RepID=A0A0C3FN32_PILCF|nr:hypothetical protein PILCRDRAFT_822380 [Piloderma croceum F 1598]
MFKFALPQPTSKNKLEECPIVRLPDSAEDWTHVLRALCDRSYQFDGDESQSFSVVAAFARLGTKYEFRQLRTEAVKRLTFEFPSQFNRLDSGIHIIGANDLVFRAITLARETNMLFVLPCAMAICCQSYTIRDLLNGVGSPDYPYIVLSTEDQRAYLSGWYDLIHMQAKETFKWLDPHMRDTLFPDCVSRARCTKARARVLYSIGMSHPISLCNPFSRFDWEMVMCVNCTIVSKVQHARGRKNIWIDLPSFFGLPGWDELLKE